MTLSESLSAAADYTRQFFSRAGDVLVLFILTLIPIVNIFTLGYYGRVIADRPESRQPPKAERYTDMFVGGLKYVGAAIIWSIPIIIAAIIAVILVFAPFAITMSQPLPGNFTDPSFWQNFNSTSWSQLMSQYPGVFASLIIGGMGAAIIIAAVTIAIWIFAFMGMVHMFKTGKFSKAFALGEIHSVISRIGWGRYLGYLLVVVFLGIIASVFNNIPVIGYFVWAFLELLLLVFLGRTVGLLYDSAMAGSGMAAPPHAPAPASAAAAETTAAPAAPAAEAPTVYCSKCGAPNPQEAIYCNRCGSPIVK